MRRIAVVSMIAIFTMDTWAAIIGRADTRHCGVEREAFEKADAQWQHLSPAEQRRFPSYLVIVHDAENAWRTCAGLPASQRMRRNASPTLLEPRARSSLPLYSDGCCHRQRRTQSARSSRHRPERDSMTAVIAPRTKKGSGLPCFRMMGAYYGFM